MQKNVDVLVIGAGPRGAGLAADLKALNIDVLVIEKNDPTHSTWDDSHMHSDHKVFVPASITFDPKTSFPHFLMGASDHDPIKKDNYADPETFHNYILWVRKKIQEVILYNTEAKQLQQNQDGTFLVTTKTGTIQAEKIVIATGTAVKGLTEYIPDTLNPSDNLVHFPGCLQKNSSFLENLTIPKGGTVNIIGANNAAPYLIQTILEKFPETHFNVISQVEIEKYTDKYTSDIKNINMFTKNIPFLQEHQNFYLNGNNITTYGNSTVTNGYQNANGHSVTIKNQKNNEITVLTGDITFVCTGYKNRVPKFFKDYITIQQKACVNENNQLVLGETACPIFLTGSPIFNSNIETHPLGAEEAWLMSIIHTNKRIIEKIRTP